MPERNPDRARDAGKTPEPKIETATPATLTPIMPPFTTELSPSVVLNLGKQVRKAWVEFHIANGILETRKIAPWEDMSDFDKSLDMAIGCAVFTHLLSDYVFASKVRVERLKQDVMWGGPEHDDKHAIVFWTDLITILADEATPGLDLRLTPEQVVFKILNGDKVLPVQLERFEKKMVKVAATAKAALEVTERIKLKIKDIIE